LHPKKRILFPPGIAQLELSGKEEMGSGHRTFGKHSRKSLLRRLAVTTLLFLVSLMIYFFVQLRDKHREVSLVSKPSSPSVPFPAAFSMFSAYLASPLVNLRPTYPYSVIPGGVRTVAELKEAIARDPLVKAHYQGFDLAKAHVIRLKENRAVYVSYRSGSAIFWTSRKLILHKGETAITDGTNLSRTRCGNRIADKPSLPHSDPEPTPVALDTPLLTPPVFGPPVFPFSPPAPPPGGFIPSPPPVFIPIYPPIYPGGGGGGRPTPHNPPTPVTEPDGLYLLLVALPLAWLALKKSRP
jgi:hypothetical protein